MGMLDGPSRTRAKSVDREPGRRPVCSTGTLSARPSNNSSGNRRRLASETRSRRRGGWRRETGNGGAGRRGTAGDLEGAVECRADRRDGRLAANASRTRVSPARSSSDRQLLAGAQRQRLARGSSNRRGSACDLQPAAPRHPPSTALRPAWASCIATGNLRVGADHGEHPGCSACLGGVVPQAEKSAGEIPAVVLRRRWPRCTACRRPTAPASRGGRRARGWRSRRARSTGTSADTTTRLARVSVRRVSGETGRSSRRGYYRIHRPEPSLTRRPDRRSLAAGTVAHQAPDRRSLAAGNRRFTRRPGRLLTRRPGRHPPAPAAVARAATGRNRSWSGCRRGRRARRAAGRGSCRSRGRRRRAPTTACRSSPSSAGPR